MRRIQRLAACVCALAMTFALFACSGDSQNAASTEETDQTTTQTEEASSEESSEQASGALYGKPWVTSIFQGNLPPEQPELKDDFYTHYNYEYLSEHQLQLGSALEEHGAELKEATLALIKDESKNDHDLEQMRILYNQASDLEALKEQGISELQPYLDRIDAVTSIEEMNALLTAADFPFSPFIQANITLADTRDVNIVSVGANLALVDTIMVGGTYYQDTDDEQAAENMLAALKSSGENSLIDLIVVGMSEDEMEDAFNTIVDFERAHGKFVDYNGMYSMMDFGEMAEAAKHDDYTLDELCAACPNFPMREVLEKLGKAGSPDYTCTPAWVEAFNDLWTDDNIDAIKLVAKVRVLNETRNFRDPSILNQMLEERGLPGTDEESFGYGALDNQNTLAVALSQSYVHEVLGDAAKERLTKLSQDLVNTYKDVMGATPWLSDEAKERVLEKLDHITLNVLEPTGGYYDFSGVDLTPSEQGGTLLGNYLTLKQYRLDQESQMIGQPAVPACPWYTIESTLANAFYDPTSNSINILPGIVTSLLYTDDMSDQDLLAGIGFTIGHEISHGFDYQGAQFDAYGTPNPLFADADADAFVLKATSLASYYKTIEVAPDVMVNGENIVTEAAADLCGMQAVLELAKETEGIDYDAFFRKNASVWAQVLPEQYMAILLLDTHTMQNQRVNVNAQMFDPIYDSLGIKEGDGMYLAPEERINIWGPNA